MCFSITQAKYFDRLNQDLGGRNGGNLFHELLEPELQLKGFEWQLQSASRGNRELSSLMFHSLKAENVKSIRNLQ